MQNKWLQKHFKRNTGWATDDNSRPISLNWEHEDFSTEMPVLRANYVELQAVWNVYAASLFAPPSTWEKQLFPW